MPKFRKCTRTTVVAVLRRMIEQCEKEPGEDGFAQMYAEMLDPALQDLHDEDAFGTEGQLHPRGDPRD